MRYWITCLVAGGGLLSVMPGFAEGAETMDESLRTLFQPLSFRDETSVSQASPEFLGHIEFRGVLDLCGETYVTLLDTTTSRSRTLRIGEIIDGWRVVSYSSGRRLIVIEGYGQRKSLALAKAKIVAVELPDPRSNPANSNYGGLRRRRGEARPLLDSTPVVDQPASR
jgi:hypothetical protein